MTTTTKITARTRKIVHTIRDLRPVSEGHRAYLAGRADNVPSLKLVLLALNDTLDHVYEYIKLRDPGGSSSSRSSNEDVQQMSDRGQLLELFECLLAQYHTQLTLVEEDY